MHCQQCGKETSSDAKFCGGCGRPIQISANGGNQYAGFWIRFAACAIDSVALLIPTLLVSFLYRATIPADNPFSVLVDFFDFLMNLGIWWIYVAVLHSSVWQATLGKKLLGMKVVDYAGNRISFGRATGRYFAGFLSVLLLFIGLIMVAFTKQKQALHDKLASTLVVRIAQT